MNFTSTKLVLIILFLLGNISTNAQNVIWSEDFAGGQIPAGWTNTDASGQLSTVWEWKVSSSIWMSSPFMSPTAANGFVTFDSGTPGFLSSPHDVRLTTSAIDCSSLSTVVAKFSNQYAYDEQPSQTWLGVSTDGTSFSYFPILLNLPSDEIDVTEQVEEVDISAVAAGESTVYLQFRWLANYEYAWSIDDIKIQDMLTSVLPNNLAIADYLLPNAHQIPIRQLDTIFFDAEIENVGINTQTNVQVEAKVTNSMNQDVFSEIVTLNNIVSSTNTVNANFNNVLLPNALQTGTYTLSYTITQDSIDNDSTDNQAIFDFIISDTTFAIDDGDDLRLFAGGTGNLNAGSYGLANYYYIPNDSSIATSVTFAVHNAFAVQNETVDFFLYQVDIDGDGDLDNNGDNVFNSADVTSHVVAFANYTFTGFEQEAELINVPLENFLNPNDEIQLMENGNYLVYFEYNGSNLMLVSVDKPINYNNVTTIGVNIVTDTWALGGLPNGFLAILRLHIADIGTSTQNVLNPTAFSITPNPASEILYVDIDLEKISENTMITILDVNGKVVQRERLKNIQQKILQYNIAQLSVGIYFINIQTEYGSRTEKLIIFK